MAGLALPATAAALTSGLKGATSNGGSRNQSYSYSHTNGLGATASSNQQALAANTSAMNAWREAAEYNAEQARIQREWQEKMANTVYQRTVKDMKSAGINPILAANMGLGTASVGSGATASIGNPQTYMGQSFAEQNSASQSSGNSWNNSESGLATGLALLGQAISGAIESINGSKTIELAFTGLKDIAGSNDVNEGYSKFAELIGNMTGTSKDKVKDILMTKDSGKYKALTNQMKKFKGTYTGQETKLINQP